MNETDYMGRLSLSPTALESSRIHVPGTTGKLSGYFAELERVKR